MSDGTQEPSAFTMKAPDQVSGSTLYITQSAADRLQALISKEDDGTHFRITVLSGGCNGFQYKFDFTNTVNDDDLVFTHDGLEVVVDDVSFDLLEDVTLDYVQEMIGAAFTLKNPNATTSCGCGNSFSI